MENSKYSDTADKISSSPQDSLDNDEIPPDTDLNTHNNLQSTLNEIPKEETIQNQEEEQITIVAPIYQVIQDNQEPPKYQYLENNEQYRYQPEKVDISFKVNQNQNQESLNQEEQQFLSQIYQEKLRQNQDIQYNLDFRKNIQRYNQESNTKKNKIVKIERTSPVDQYKNRIKEINKNYIVKTNKIKIQNRNKEPRDSKSKIIIDSSSKNFQKNPDSYRVNYQNPLNREESRGEYFIESPIRKFNLKKANINYRNGKFYNKLYEIPRDKNSFKNKNEYMRKGIKTGEYKFIGEKTFIEQKYNPQAKYIISNEEIVSEINKRNKNRTKTEKNLRFEVVDKFYVLTELERKNIKPQDKTYRKEKVKREKVNSSKFNKDECVFFQSRNRENFQYKTKTKSNKNNTFDEINNYDNYYNYKRNNKTNDFNTNYNKNKNYNYNNYNIIRNQYNNLNLNFSSASIYPNDNYSRYLLEQINKIRADPQSFIGVIEDSKGNIVRGKYGRLIYNGKIKIALSKGESAFNEAIEYLKNASPMKKLEFSHIITPKLPSNESEIRDNNDLGKKVNRMIDNGIIIKSYWRDVIKDPEISFLLMIVDDNGFKSGKRRKDIMNPNMRYIGITSTEINGYFVCYITLSVNIAK